MSDPLRTDAPRAIDAAPDAGRDAKIEQLLLAGLDHYFAEQYQRAVNVWTRVLFLDRSHPRARAYIERARSALAERQRRSEERLQTGVAALHRGDGAEARRLIQAAINGGAPGDEALVLPPVARARVNRLRSARPRPDAADSRIAWSLVALAGAVLAVGALTTSAVNRAAWRTLAGLAHAPTVPAVGPTEASAALPVPRRGEMALGRARALAAAGRLLDALAALDAVHPTDPQQADADRLRADLQRQLLGLPTDPGGRGDRPQP